ncbi:hypothetical protein ABAC402_11885 [Asticcacaulis sp. AC402]|nr:hypothetical protein ABAC402_11885 [Asticcacaulis sp. AC402]
MMTFAMITGQPMAKDKPATTTSVSSFKTD